MRIISDEPLRHLKTAFQAAHVRHKKRAIAALKSTGNFRLANAVENCRKGKRCSSPYCGSCRHGFAKRLEGRIWEHLSRKPNDQSDPIDDLRFLTVLVDLKYPMPGEVKNAVKDARKDLQAFARAFPAIWMQGSFEFEFIDVPTLISTHNCSEDEDYSRKRRTIMDMLGLEKPTHSKLYRSMVLVHYHCVVDLNGTDEEAVKRWLANRIKGAHRTRLQKTRKDQPLKEKIWKLSSYPFKDRVQFNNSMNTKNYKSGKYLSDNELSSLVSLYNDCSPKGNKLLLITHKGRRKKNSRK